MDIIKLDIKKVVSENLQKTRKEKLVEEFNNFDEVTDPNDFYNVFLKKADKLISEGYTEEEILYHIFEQENFFDKLTSGVNKVIGGDTKWGEMAKSSLWSGAKEFLAKWFLSFLGVKGGVGTSIAQFLGNLEYKDLFIPFKDKVYCQQHMKDITSGILEVIVRYIGGKVTGVNRNSYEWGDVGTVGIGNIFGEAIKESDINNKIADKFCRIIFK